VLRAQAAVIMKKTNMAAPELWRSEVFAQKGFGQKAVCLKSLSKAIFKPFYREKALNKRL